MVHRKTIADTADLNEKLAASRKLIALQEKIIRLADQNTKDIEKQLKKATDASQIESILGL
jgi:2-polyprenyl-3-methyl-5-hydroxy-6-metoxy-1,4-benzoquinol methylase